MRRQSRCFRISAVAMAVFVAACQPKGSSGSSGSSAALLAPTNDTAAAPDSFRVAFETSKGRFVIQAFRSWAPRGADRFYYLARNGYYDGNKFFRVLPGFVVQWGIHGDPRVNAAWTDRNIRDDSVRQSNQPGTVTFATGGPDTRTTQLFVNLRDNKRLDAMGFSPFGRVVEGMNVVQSLNSEYGEGAPSGNGPDQDRIEKEGNPYLDRMYPRLDSIVHARVEQD
jgi:peptidyl-prolyl cis-trans isomerase A (cyclophilin A)